MAAQRKPAAIWSPHPEPPPIARAWHIYKNDGLGETVVANACLIFDGVLSFYNVLPTPDYILVRAFPVRAFQSGRWDDCVLVDTPYAPAVQLSRPE